MQTSDKLNLEVYRLFVRTVSEAETIESMGDQLSQLMVGALGIKGAALFILDPQRELLTLLSSAGLSNNYIQKGPLLVDPNIRLRANREPVIVSDAQNSPQLQYPEAAKAEGVRALISCPVVMRGKIIGALRLYHSEPWEISAGELDLLDMLTRHIGMALMYFRVVTAVAEIKETMDEIHPIWL